MDSDFYGLQQGFVNIVKGTTKGLQTGLYNSAEDMEGIQIGIVNRTNNLNGLQIGIANLNMSGDPFKFLPFVNFSF